MVIGIEIISSKGYDYFKMVIKNSISISDLQKSLQVPEKYHILVNGFYELDDYQVRPYDQISFIVNPVITEVKNIN
ncbi:hypothetical protein U472_03780 [Orenia metallireducens]|jgi:hypothetical protein|uniref:Uncharacterized protein n=1 Tax=Orenia metallireducens TaxID=1413210 RepID=A0A1C0ABC5_9FIRM|nr:hypothetical protein [Orenia metallireducens]OCL27682.1 hypothetical protein U472_03780 [Orenia metallireducens]